MGAKGSNIPFRFACVVGLTAVVLLAPGTVARGDAGIVAWQAPTPAAGSVVQAAAGTKLSLQLSASSLVPAVSVHIKPAGRLPQGAKLVSNDGNHATAVLTWTPRGRQIGTHQLRFVAVDNTVAHAALALAFTVNITEGVQVLSSGNTSQWAYVLRGTVVRSAPTSHAHARTHLSIWTPENYPNVALALQQRVERSGTWVQIRLAVLPNNSTGWVKRGALGSFKRTLDHVVVDRASTTLTLYRNGRSIFRTRVGVGKPGTPTPRGEFTITEKMTGFHNAAYGPIAFGTTARSAVLTDWPGGGFIGIHGTDAPGLIPGRISHGCVRLRNAAILHLARLMRVGTPLTVQ